MSQVSKKNQPLKGKGGLVMLAVVAVLGVWAWMDSKTPVREEGAQPPVSDFTHVTSKDVVRVEVRRPSGGFALAKQGGRWVFQSPKPYRANGDSVVEWLKNALEQATIARAVETKSVDPASFGFTSPIAELVLTTSGGTRTLQIGKDFRQKDEKTGSYYFARDASDGRVFLLPTSQVESVRSKKIDELRDKRLVEIKESKEVSRLAFQRGADTTEVVRSGEKWNLSQPFPAPAQSSDIDFLIDDLKGSTVDAFVENRSSDLAAYGLTAPKLVLKAAAGGAEQEIAFGSAAKDGKVYAVRPGDGEVMLVAKTTFDKFNKRAGDLRSRQLITLDKDTITNVQLKNRHGEIRLQKTGGTEWQIAGAPAGKNKAKADMVQRVLDTITGSAYKSVEEAPKDLKKYGLDNPQIAVTVNAGTGTSQVYMIGKKASGERYYGKGEPNAVFEVESYAHGDLDVKPDAFKEKPAGK
jgi:hypothetical protein